MKYIFYFLSICLSLQFVSCNLGPTEGPQPTPDIITFGPKLFPVSSKNDVGEYVFENSDGNYMITGGSFDAFGLGEGKAIFMTIDENGNEISPKRYDLGGPKFTYCGYAIEIPSIKQYFVIGRILDETSNKWETFLDRFDASGNEIVGFPNGYPGANNFSAGGGFMFYSNGSQTLTLIGSEFAASNQCDAGMYIMKCNLNGVEIAGSKKSIFMNTGSDFKKAIKDADNDYYYILGQKRDCNQSNKTDLFLTKITETGDNLLSPVYFGGTGIDDARDFYMTDQNEFVFLSTTNSKGQGLLNIWVFKTDLEGNMMGKDTTFGIANSVLNPFSMQRTNDGGCIIAAYSNAPVQENHGGDDIVLYKLDKNLKYQWHKYYGTSRDDQPRCVKQTSDGGFIVTGYSVSASNNFDVLVLKTDQNGDF